MIRFLSPWDSPPLWCHEIDPVCLQRSRRGCACTAVDFATYGVDDGHAQRLRPGYCEPIGVSDTHTCVPPSQDRPTNKKIHRTWGLCREPTRRRARPIRRSAPRTGTAAVHDPRSARSSKHGDPTGFGIRNSPKIVVHHQPIDIDAVGYDISRLILQMPQALRARNDAAVEHDATGKIHHLDAYC